MSGSARRHRRLRRLVVLAGVVGIVLGLRELMFRLHVAEAPTPPPSSR